MGLFDKRNRSASASRPNQRPNNANASSAAHSAASLAFLANRPSTPNLSASAAAAALRTMSPAPTNVAQVQTRRTLQRQNSGSSTASAPRGRGQGLQRRDSGGSMTERTFRSPSPHGTGPNGQRPKPPVPQIPANYNNVPPLPVKSHRRTASMEPPPPRVLSPPLIRPAGRGVSLDRGPAAPPSKSVARISSLQNINELERTDSNSSQNFSYPNRARPMSPNARGSASPTASQQSLVSPAQLAASGAAAGSAASTPYLITRASEQPVKKKKKKIVRGLAEGSHLQQGSMGGPPTVTPLATGPALISQPATNGNPQTTPVKKKKKKVAVAATGEGSHLPAARPMSPTYSSDSDSTPEKVQKRVQRASGQLNKQPSIVREDWEGEQDGDTSLASTARQREEQGLSPITGPANLQGKKASTAANVSRKIDDATALAKTENSAVYNAVTIPQAANKQHLAVAENGAPTSRTTSLSPSRSMRFSDRLSTDLTAGKRHEPLPRSVSPAKSALKHHSPSPTDPRFPGRYIHSQTASEASDNASNISADGVGPYKKKKSARVSFDAEPEIVGTAAAAEQTGTPKLLSPQDKVPGKKGWFGFGKAKTTPALGTIAAEDELEEVMKPRPALPAFGSVRRGVRGNEAGEATPSYHSASTTGTVAPTSSNLSSASSETSSASQIPTLDTSISSDHAIGSLIAQDAAQKQVHDPQLPLPPEVTSVEGTGYHSDTESEDGKENQNHNQTETHKEAIAQPRALDTTSATVITPMPLEKVPTVTLQPPTPGLEQRQSDEWLVTVPGGFPSSAEVLGSYPTPEPESSKQLGSTTPAGLGIAEPASPETVSAASPSEAPLESLRRRSLDNEDNESSAGDSIYSDAAEEASEHGDGFGSINAIIESPVAQTSSRTITTPPESPVARNFNQARPEGGARTASWDQAQNHWSGIAQAYRQGLQPQQSEQQQVFEMPVVQAYADKKPSIKKKKKVAAKPKERLIPDSPPNKSLSQSSSYPRVAPTDVPAPPPFRHSMRAQQEDDQQYFRSSMRQRPQSSQQPIARPASPRMQEQGPPARKPKGTLQKRNLPPAAAVPSAVTIAARTAASERPHTQIAPPPQSRNLQRTMSNDSDSESSFKKRHRRGASSQGSTMRRTMRAAPEPQPQSTRPAGRGGIRSMSPPVDRRPMSPGFGQKTMRTSMRQSTESQTPTRRPQLQQQRSSSLFGRRNKDKSPTRAAPMPLTKKITSRFGDSDDEEDARPKVFKSRFEDSSDDEAEPVKYRPVRGIPRRADEGDSTDLEDSDDEKRMASKAKLQPLAVNTDQANGAGRAAEMPSSPTSSTAKKGGFFSRFRSKKEKDPSSKSRLGGTIAERNARIEHNQPALAAAREEENISSPRKVQREDKKQASRLGFSTIEERDRVLEQTRVKLEEAREQPSEMSRPALSTQGRETPTRIMSDSWPLPAKMPAIEEDRPNTSDGVDLPYTQSAADLGPGLRERVDTTDTVRTAGGTPVYGRSGKKKRFTLLRKAFGLQD